MATRRNFIKQSGLLMGALAAPNFLISCMESTPKKYKPGLQLYTIREAMEKAPKESLEKVAEIGYQIVESATYTGTQKFYGMAPSEFSSVLQDSGLKIPSGHYALGDSDIKGTIRNGWEKAVEDADKVGMDYMVCAYLDEGDRQSLDDYKKRAEEFNKAGEVCKEAGIQFCYHNHDFEFDKIDGKVPYDVLLSETDEELVKMEMDMYWMVHGDQDPVKRIKENPGRFELWHLKDMDEDGDFTEIGNGSIDWDSIFAEAETSGLEHFFVEQDQTPGDPFDSIKESIDYLEDNIL